MVNTTISFDFDVFLVLGVVKAYTTRVGEGPFPSELFDAVGEEIRKKGGEFGTTTGIKQTTISYTDISLRTS